MQKFYKDKNEDISELKRNDGNKAFKNKEYQTAISLYSQAITKAPADGKNK